MMSSFVCWKCGPAPCRLHSRSFSIASGLYNSNLMRLYKSGMARRRSAEEVKHRDLRSAFVVTCRSQCELCNVRVRANVHNQRFSTEALSGYLIDWVGICAAAPQYPSRLDPLRRVLATRVNGYFNVGCCVGARRVDGMCDTRGMAGRCYRRGFTEKQWHVPG